MPGTSRTCCRASRTGRCGSSWSCASEKQELRLSARELLHHPFLRFKRSDPGRDNLIVLVDSKVSKGGDKEKEREKEREKEKQGATRAH